MKKNIYYSLLISAMVSVSVAEETRQVDKHEHGVGELNIAIEGNAIDFEFFIPGADIVGFEYEAKTESDIALVNAALEKFENFDNIFSLPESSNCNLVNSEIGVNQDDDHDDHSDALVLACWALRTCPGFDGRPKGSVRSRSKNPHPMQRIKQALR